MSFLLLRVMLFLVHHPAHVGERLLFPGILYLLFMRDHHETKENFQIQQILHMWCSKLLILMWIINLILNFDLMNLHYWFWCGRVGGWTQWRTLHWRAASISTRIAVDDRNIRQNVPSSEIKVSFFIWSKVQYCVVVKNHPDKAVASCVCRLFNDYVSPILGKS